MTSSGSTASARPAHDTDMRVPSPSSVEPQSSISLSPGLSSAIPSLSAPMRSFGPGRSWRIATCRPAAVGEVEAGNVESGLDQALEHLRLTGGRSDGGDDLRAACHLLSGPT